MTDKGMRAAILLGGLLWAFSAVLHLPSPQSGGTVYSDITALWNRDVVAGGHFLQAPYLQYKLEYPPVTGLIIWLGQALSSLVQVGAGRASAFLGFEALLMLPFLLGTVILLMRLCPRLGLPRSRVRSFFLGALSLILYGVYNWDIVAVFFALASFWSFLDEKPRLTGFLVGLGALAKFSPLVMVPAMILGFKTTKARVTFLLVTAATFAAGNLPFAALNPDLWAQLYTHTLAQAQNTWLLWLTADPSTLHLFSIILTFAFLTLVLRRGVPPREAVLASWLAWYGATYLFDPQMFVQVAAFAVLMPAFGRKSFRAADLLNVILIFFWFVPDFWFGFAVPAWLRNPLMPWSLANVAGAARQIIVLGALFYWSRLRDAGRDPLLYSSEAERQTR